MNSAPEIRPGRIWYAFAAIILAVGIAAFVILLVGFITGISGLADSMTRVVAPGTFDINLDKPGSYTIFNEYRSIVKGRVYSSPVGLAGLTCTLADKATGRTIPVTAATFSTTYSTGSYAGRSILDFTVPSPGLYTLTAQYDSGATGPPAALAIGHGFTSFILGLIIKLFVAIGALALSLLLSALIFVFTIVRRRRPTRHLREITP